MEAPVSNLIEIWNVSEDHKSINKIWLILILMITKQDLKLMIIFQV